MGAPDRNDADAKDRDAGELDAVVARHLGQVVPRRTRLKAHDYLNQSAVDLVEVTERRVLAAVRGTERYSVALERVEVAGRGTWYGNCTCPAFQRFGPCKHLYAAALECAATGVFESRGGDASKVESTGDRDWRVELDRITERYGRALRDPWPGVLARTKLQYDLTERSGRPCIGVVVEGDEARAWAELSRLGDELDRAVLSRLAEDGRPPSDATAVPLDPARAEAVLPLLARSGRLTFGGDAVTYGGDGAFALALGFEADRETGGVNLMAGLVREDTWRALDEASAWPGIGWAVDGEGRLVRLSTRASDTAVLDVARRGGVRAPASEANELRERCAAAGLPGLGPGAEVAVPRRVRLELSAARPNADEIDARLSFDYGGARVRASSPSENVAIEGGASRRRSAEAERRALGLFLAAGGRAAAASDLARRDGVVPRAALDAVLGDALERDWQVALEGLPVATADEVRASAREEDGSLVLEGWARFGARRLSLAELLDASDRGRIAFADGTQGVLGGSLRRALEWARRLGEVRGDEVRVDAARGWLAAPLLSGLGVDLPESVRRARDAFDERRELPLPAAFEGELRDYQRASLAWFDGLERLGLGGCLADDMGLGKTVQVLARMVQRREQGLAQGPSLVVAPRSVLHHWQEQAARFAPFLDVRLFHGANRDLDAAREAAVVLVSYGTLRQDAGAFARAPWDLVVLDESQQIKNAASQTAAAARGLEARARLALSGTPVENHLGELASLMAFLAPGLLGARADALTSARDERAARDLFGALAPLFLRRTKAEVLTELPPRTEVTLWCELSGEQADRYEALRRVASTELLGEDAGAPASLFDAPKDARAKGATDAPSHVHVLAHLTRLRQVACHPGLVDDALSDAGCAKFDELLPRLERLAEQGRKALVFSQFTGLLQRLAPQLDARGIGWELLDGRTRNRAARVERFRTSASVTAFLVSLKAGGTGLDLTAADTVFLLDPWWNPAAERQAIDRAHRMGQDKPVFAYRLIARGTVEERVAQLARSKGALLEDLFASEGLGTLDRETLTALVR